MGSEPDAEEAVTELRYAPMSPAEQARLRSQADEALALGRMHPASDQEALAASWAVRLARVLDMLERTLDERERQTRKMVAMLNVKVERDDARAVLREVLAAEAWDDPSTHEHKTIAEWLEDPDLRARAEAVAKETD